jgi:hypothetical protein
MVADKNLNNSRSMPAIDKCSHGFEEDIECQLMLTSAVLSEDAFSYSDSSFFVEVSEFGPSQCF